MNIPLRSVIAFPGYVYAHALIGQLTRSYNFDFNDDEIRIFEKHRQSLMMKLK